MTSIFILSTLTLSSQGFSLTTPSYTSLRDLTDRAAVPNKKKNPYSRYDSFLNSKTLVDDDTTKVDDKAGVEEYKNVATKILSNFMQSGDGTMNDATESSNNDDPLGDINFNVAKIDKVDDLQLLA